MYKGHIEVVFNVSFSLFKNNGGLEFISKLTRYELFDRYSENFSRGGLCLLAIFNIKICCEIYRFFYINRILCRIKLILWLIV